MDVKRVAIGELSPHPLNYNTHPQKQLCALADSIKKFGQYKNIVVRGGTILAGHGLVEAAKIAGIEHLYVVDVSNLSDTDAEALLLADNALQWSSVADIDALYKIMENLCDVDIPGVTDEWLKSLGVETCEPEVQQTDFDSETTIKRQRICVDVHELEHDALRRDIGEVIKKYESTKLV